MKTLLDLLIPFACIGGFLFGWTTEVPLDAETFYIALTVAAILLLFTLLGYLALRKRMVR